MNLGIPDFLKFLEQAVRHYERTAPTVSAYLDDLYIRIENTPDKVLLTEMMAAEALLSDGQWEQPNYAANRIYKLARRLGRDTTGHAGF